MRFVTLRNCLLNVECLKGVELCFGRRFSTADVPLTFKHDSDAVIFEEYSKEPEYPEDIPTPFEQTDRRIAHGRQLLRQMVRNMPTVEEKIDFVNPYERPWRWEERRRHRLWHRPLDEPRKAYQLSPVPAGYDSLKMYKYATNTHCLEGLPKCYESICIQEERFTSLKDRLESLLKDELLGRRRISDSIKNFVCQIADIICQECSSDYAHLKSMQVGTDVRYESFFERGGFRELNVDFPKPSKIPCDGPYRLGELAFCFRDKSNLQLRSDQSLPPFVSSDAPLCFETVPKLGYSPASYGAYRDSDILWNSPGYELGDPYEFGHLMINSTKNCREMVDKIWKCEPEEYKECLLSMSIISCFSWLNAQAHFKGFNQLNDMTYPLMTQAMFTDGQSWFFSAYQLNTLDLLHNFEDFEVDSDRKAFMDRPKCNICWFEGPFQLFENDPNTMLPKAFNLETLNKILRMFLLAPGPRTDVLDFKPYVTQFVHPDKSAEELIEKNVQAQQDIRYSI